MVQVQPTGGSRRKVTGWAGFQAAQAVVVHLQNVGLFPAVHTLGSFVVIHQNQLLALQIQQVPAAIRPTTGPRGYATGK